ncbi:MAG: LytTR family DNA-binding domain-containing protein [Hespellia sp.]|nr:LytTR family DNA-binding domain-containing protein [Hespellia sp.]
MVIGICDDERVYCDTLEQYILSYAEAISEVMTVRSYVSGSELLKSDISDLDLCFLDIEMPEIQGMEIARDIGERNPECKIVFISNHKELVQEGYKVHAYRFLYKPVNQDELEEVMKDAKKDMKQLSGIFRNNSLGNPFFRLRDIKALEAAGDEVIIYTKDEHYTDKRSLIMLEEQLDDRFYRCHHSFMVNLDHVKEIEYGKNKIIMTDEAEFPISFRKKAGLKKAYYDRMRRRAGWM